MGAKTPEAKASAQTKAAQVRNKSILIIPIGHLSSVNDIRVYMNEFIHPRYKDDADSLPNLAFLGGMLHMLDMFTLSDSPAEREIRNFKTKVSQRLTYLTIKKPKLEAQKTLKSIKDSEDSYERKM